MIWNLNYHILQIENFIDNIAMINENTWIDEGLELCLQCPRLNGLLTYPRTIESLLAFKPSQYKQDSSGQKAYSTAATFSCKHKITKRPICAIPCNGMLELCEDDEDEKCQGTGILICGIITTVCASVFITSGFLKKRFATFNTKSMASQEVYKSEESSHKAFLYITLYFFKSKLDIENARIAAKDYYQIHVIGPKDNFFMDNFGTNDLTAFFYDCVNDAFTIRVLHVLQQRIPNIFAISKKILTNIISKVILCVFSLALRYSDLYPSFIHNMATIEQLWLQLISNDHLLDSTFISCPNRSL